MKTQAKEQSRAEKKTEISQKIIPHLWFDSEAEEAATLYTSLFDNSKTGRKTYYGKEGFEIHGQPEGKLMTIEFELAGRQFIGLNGGPHFKFSPAISFYVTCETEDEVDELWTKLSEGGEVLMPLDKFDWSKKYGWVQDRYGLTWQVSLGELKDVHGQKIVPSLMYVGEEGQAEEAINLYTSLFEDSKITGVMHYGPDQEQPEGSVMHAQFRLNSGEVFMAMDSGLEHNFSFNEAISFLILCEDQEEIDHFWSLSSVPESEQCGWLKDKFGVSWQVSPTILSKMLKDPDKEKVGRVTKAFLQMKKFDIEKLKQAYERT